MKKAYPAIFHKDNNWIIVNIPDLDISTQGKNYAEAIEIARDAIGLMGITLEDEGKTIPEPSELDKITKENDSDIVTLIDIDFEEYRRKSDLRTDRRNVTLPKWLDYEAKKQKINVSAVLQEALKKALGKEDPVTK